MTDPIADMLIRIKNALGIREETVNIPHSSIKENIAKILVNEGYVGNFSILTRMNKRFIRINLKYRKDKKGLPAGRQGVISGLRRVSKPGRRVYSDARCIPRVQSGFGTAIISTSQGLKTDEQARSQKLGGEVVCYVW